MIFAFCVKTLAQTDLTIRIYIFHLHKMMSIFSNVCFDANVCKIFLPKNFQKIKKVFKMKIQIFTSS